INGRTCRLRDIQEFFAGTGLGGAKYALIEQGQIGEIVSARPTELRAIIEEAAGITKFKAKKHLAELKLEATRQNLTRLNDIIEEVEKQLSSLKRQAAKARRYKRIREEMRQYSRLFFRSEYRRIQKGLSEAVKEIDKARREELALAEQIEANEKYQRE